MKKRMWLWCLIAAFGMSIVACGDDDEKETPAPPQTGGEQTPVVPPTDGGEQTPDSTQSVIVVDTMEVIANVEVVPYTGGTIQFVTKTNVVYSVDTDQEWIKITSDGRALTAEYTVTATVDANEGEAREGVITVTFEDEATTVKTVTVKQAAKPAEDTPDTPVGPTAETVTVNVEVYSGVANQTISASEVATKLGVEDLAAAIADGTVTYVGLNADGTVYTKEDGSTPAYTTNGPCGHWYSTECNPMVWGTEGLTMLAYIEGDGASYTLGYANAAGFAEGDNYKLAGKYIMGETEVIFEVVMTGVAAPESPEFVAPEADFTYSAELEHNNSWWTCSWAMTAEDEMTVLATLGLDGDYDWEGALATAVEEGAVIVKGFKADGTLTEDVTADHTGNTGYWFAPDGTVSTYGTGAMCADNFEYNAGTMCILGSVTEAGNTYPGYYVYTAGDAQVIVKLECVVTAAPVLEFSVEEEYEFTIDVVYAAGYPDVANGFNISSTMTDIADIIGGTPDTFQMGLADGTFQAWNVTDGWFGVDGAQAWGSSARFCMKPQADGTFVSNCPMDGMTPPDVAKCTFRYGNTATMKAVDVKITVNIAAE